MQTTLNITLSVRNRARRCTTKHRRMLVCGIRQWLNYNHLILNETKTEAIVFRSAAVLSPSPLSNIYAYESPTSLTPTVRDIGVLPDSRLDMTRCGDRRSMVAALFEPRSHVRSHVRRTHDPQHRYRGTWMSLLISTIICLST